MEAAMPARPVGCPGCGGGAPGADGWLRGGGAGLLPAGMLVQLCWPLPSPPLLPGRVKRPLPPEKPLNPLLPTAPFSKLIQISSSACSRHANPKSLHQA
jgi:hypothetical protein